MPITLLPFWRDLKTYNLPSFRADILAAISVALMALPQAMAYAFVAGLPTSAGIWAAIFGTIFTASFGESRRLISGPTNMIAILIQSGTSEIIYTYYGRISGVELDVIALRVVLQLVLIIGIFQILAGGLRLGRLVQFTSRSVIVGYMAGAALAIAVTQLFPFFGIREMDGYHPIYQQGLYLFGYLPTLHLPTTLIAIGCLILLIVFYQTSEKVPAAAIMFIIAGGVVWLFNLSPENARGVFDINEGERVEKVTLLRDVGPIYSDLPKLAPPFFEIRIMTKLIPLAFAITLLSAIEATAIGRSYTSAREPPYNDNQELYGLGLSNVLSSFLGAMPSSGSFSRSALN
ncbi:MAG: SulP family inorganic anion transporter, partial [Chlamydiales bacterium]